MKKLLIISLICSVITYVISYIVFYRSLLSQQPMNGILPENFTSYPPSSAWLFALPYAIGAFLIVLIIGWLYLKLLSK